MMMKAVTAEIMSEIDRRAQQEYGVSAITLMENAGRSVAETMVSEISDLDRHHVVILCGKGNNGGDGFVVARHLMFRGQDRLTVYADRAKEGPAAENRYAAEKAGVRIKPLESFMSEDTGTFSISVDALLGTGFRGSMKEPYRSVCVALNASDLVRRYAVDIPSGLNATTGEACETALEADRTVTFGLPKKGFYLNDGPRFCGIVTVADIGFPTELLDEYV